MELTQEEWCKQCSAYLQEHGGDSALDAWDCAVACYEACVDMGMSPIEAAREELDNR